jgi:hypothetical protein
MVALVLAALAMDTPSTETTALSGTTTAATDNTYL